MNQHFQPAIRPRTPQTVLDDIKAAQDDYREALAAIEREEPDADDRATEAETRVDDLRDEFDALFLDRVGLTVEQVMKAREEAVI